MSVGGCVTVELHMPSTEPAGTTQPAPVQQSAVVVHTEPDGWQETALHVSAPFAPGRHGMLSQQSAADAQLAPCVTHAVRP